MGKGGFATIGRFFNNKKKKSADEDTPKYVEPTPKDYVFTPSAQMALRVIQYHDHFEKIMDFTVHPEIRKVLKLTKPWAAAEVGTVNGHHLYTLAKKTTSEYSFVGFETGESETVLPETGVIGSYDKPLSNVKFVIGTKIFWPFPKEYHGTFDLVTTRMLGTTLVSMQWDLAFDNMMTLVKPGGMLQWIDVDLSCAKNMDRIRITKPNATKKGITEMQAGMGLLEEHYGHDCFGASRLKDIAKAHSDVFSQFEEIYNTAQITRVRKEIDKLGVAGLCRLLQFLIGTEAGQGWDQSRIDRIEGEMRAEVESGTYIPVDIYVVCVMKKPDAMPGMAQMKEGDPEYVPSTPVPNIEGPGRLFDEENIVHRAPLLGKGKSTVKRELVAERLSAANLKSILKKGPVAEMEPGAVGEPVAARAEMEPGAEGRRVPEREPVTERESVADADPVSDGEHGTKGKSVVRIPSPQVADAMQNSKATAKTAMGRGDAGYFTPVPGRVFKEVSVVKRKSGVEKDSTPRTPTPLLAPKESP